MAMVSDHPVEAATGVEPQRAASVVAIRRVGDWHHGPVSDDRSRWHGSNDRAEDEQGTELERLQPFLELAREISREVARLAADDSADVESLAETIDLIPRRERQRLTLGVFDRLPSEVQWSILERTFGDEEIREYLRTERASRLTALRRSDERRAVVGATRAAHRLDTREVPENEDLTLGLFREADARAAITRGHLSDVCARRLVLRSTGEAGVFRVIEDVFNPRGGYFVTAEYDEDTWHGERLPAHASVRVGSISDVPAGSSFEPMLYPGGRADFQMEGKIGRGRLHIGFIMVGDVDVFAS